ncbi:hypothetical protein S40293_00912 [Stachybotrys chartarum IBT 40293]|nr:hypothetical protein S40293_00912 [Stachybotrys chartarum IBT 40293]
MQPRYAVKDLGTVVIGEGGPGAGEADDGDATATADTRDGKKTLGSARFVVGDYVSCAIVSPLPDGSVAPAGSGKRETMARPRDERGGYRGRFSSHNLPPDIGRGGRNARRDGSGVAFPAGEWRRGERIPENSTARPRGRGRW